MFKMWRKKKEKGNGLPGVRWAHYIYMRRDSWTQDALKLPNTQTGSLRAEGGRKCDDQDEDEDGQAHGDPNLLLHGERERPGNISKVPVSFNVTLWLFSSFISDSYLARLLLIRHRLLGVFLGLHHVVRRLFDVGFDPVHHLPLRETVTPVGALRMTLEQGSPTRWLYPPPPHKTTWAARRPVLTVAELVEPRLKFNLIQPGCHCWSLLRTH